MSKFLNRDLRFKRRTTTVDIPELECSVILRELSIAELSSLNGNIPQQLALMIVDEQGQRVYQSPEDLINLAEMPLAIGARLIEESNKLNRMDKASVDDVLKNSEAGPNGNSASV